MWLATSSVCSNTSSSSISADPVCVDQVVGPEGILATKARIVVTNSIAFLKHFDKLVYLRRGAMLESGSYAELVSNTESELYKLMLVSLASILDCH